MPTGEKAIRKNAYMAKLINLIETEPTILIVDIDHVGSKQMQNIRLELRGKCQLLMGKNTMIRTALRKRIEETDDEGMKNLVESINGNMGFIFCKEGTVDVARECLKGHFVPAAAKTGAIAQCDVFVRSGPSGLDPAQTSFFQRLNIPTKIVKGIIDITADVKVIVKGEKVDGNAQALLAKLGMKPFEYGMKVRSVYQDGSVFDAAVLDITEDVITSKFLAGVANVAALGREIGIPTAAGLPHAMCNAFKNMVALVADIEFSFPEADEIKAILSDPEALAKMQAAAAAGAAAGAAELAGGFAFPTMTTMNSPSLTP